LKETTSGHSSNEPTIPTAEEILAGPIGSSAVSSGSIGVSAKDPTGNTIAITKTITHENSLLDEESDYLDADELHAQLMAQGKTTTGDIMQKMYQLDQVIQALTAQKGMLNAADDIVPVSNPDVIVHINGGKFPESRFVIYKNAKVCLKKDIPHIKAMEALTTVDVNHPNDTGKLAAAKAL